MKLFALFCLQGYLSQNITDDYENDQNYEEALIRAEKAIALYREIVKKALYCGFVQPKKSKFNFRFRKAAMDITWHVRNGCNAVRSRRSISTEDLNEDRFYYTGGENNAKIIFDFSEFDNEGFEDIDREVDQTLFEFFVSDYEDQPNYDYPFGYTRFRKISNLGGQGSNSSPKAVKMVKNSIRTVRKIAYSIVKDFAPECQKSGKWMRRLAVLIKDVELSWRQCLKIAPNA